MIYNLSSNFDLIIFLEYDCVKFQKAIIGFEMYIIAELYMNLDKSIDYLRIKEKITWSFFNKIMLFSIQE